MIILSLLSIYIRQSTGATVFKYIYNINYDYKLIDDRSKLDTSNNGNSNESVGVVNNYAVSTTTAEILIKYREDTDKIVQSLLLRLNNKETISPEDIKINFDNAINLADQSITLADIPFSNITKGRVYESFTLFTASSEVKTQFLQAALAQYLKALNQDVSDAESYATVGRLYAMIPSERDKAVASMTKAIELSKSDIQIELYTKVLESITK